jgi:hypothetical protein
VTPPQPSWIAIISASPRQHGSERDVFTATCTPFPLPRPRWETSSSTLMRRNGADNSGQITSNLTQNNDVGSMTVGGYDGVLPVMSQSLRTG